MSSPISSGSSSAMRWIEVATRNTPRHSRGISEEVPMHMSRFAALALAALVPLIACAQAIPTVELKGQRYRIEIAEDDASRAHGLMDRTHMDDDHGMLFVFQDDAPRAFWMKN